MGIRLDDRVALVTGAASGIGAAAAVELATAGARVVLADVQDCAEVERMVKDAGGEAITVHADVSRAADAQAMVECAVSHFGRLDCAFNNAGVEGMAEREIHQADEQAWDDALAVNLKGVWLSMKYEIPALLAAGGGAIVNGASVAALVAFDKNGSYVASKHAVLGLTKTAALEYAEQGIRVNAVCPGVVRTPFLERFTGGVPEVEARYTAIVPMARMAAPAEIAKAVLWLLSPESSYVTGHPLVVDGGLVAR